jgi:hypothetical protein
MTWCLIVCIRTFGRHETGFVFLIFALTAALNLCNAYLRCEFDYISIYACHIITQNIGIGVTANTATVNPKRSKMYYTKFMGPV